MYKLKITPTKALNFRTKQEAQRFADIITKKTGKKKAPEETNKKTGFIGFGIKPATHHIDIIT